MTHHVWGDEWFEENKKDLYEAIDYILAYVNNTAYCYVSTKEKWGSVRYEAVFPQYDHILRKCNIKVPFLKKKDTFNGKTTYYPRYLWTWDGSYVQTVWTNYGWKKLFEAVQSAIQKWPHLEDELLEDIACHEELVGSEIHAKYWTSIPQDTDS